MSVGNPGSYSQPELHQKMCGQQVRKGGSTTPLCSGKTPLGVLCPALESSVQGQVPIVVGLEKSHKNYQRVGAPLLQGKSERVGVVQTVEEKALEMSYCSVSLLPGVQVFPHKKDGDKLFSKSCYNMRHYHLI